VSAAQAQPSRMTAADTHSRLRILMVGCGDVAVRTAALLRGRARVFGLTRRREEISRLRSHGIVPLLGDLDNYRSLSQVQTDPFAVLHFAPPPSDGRDDPRTQNLIAALGRSRSIPRRFVYVSTSGVYGDCGGARITEEHRLAAQTSRGKRRVAAETRLREWARFAGVSLAILRVPGIYADTRLPLARLRAGTPVLVATDDVYTNHIHADDLARAVVAALFRGKPNRAYNVTDDAEMKMADWCDAVADAFQLPRPPRVTREEAARYIAPLPLSFMSESRRLANRRMKRELRVRLEYETPQALLARVARLRAVNRP